MMARMGWTWEDVIMLLIDIALAVAGLWAVWCFV